MSESGCKAQSVDVKYWECEEAAYSEICYGEFELQEVHVLYGRARKN